MKALLGLLAVAAAVDLPASIGGSPRWNILHVTSDQQRTSTLGCYGDGKSAWRAHSPSIDRLASEGVRFTDAYTASPVCSPSRTSVLLGVHVPVHGIYEPVCAARARLNKP